MTSLRYAIIGSGMMGQEHIRNIQLLEDSVVSAVADPDEQMRNSARELAGPDTKSFADYKDLLSADVADVLVIASPNYTHINVMQDVLASPLPILVEKPLCTTVDDCKKIVSLADGRTAPVWVAMEYRYMPPVATLIDEIEAGTIGNLKSLSIREHRFPFLEKVGDWNRFSDKTGGTLVEKCCHFFDLMRFITKADPVRVYASGGQDVNHLDETYDGQTPDIIDNAMVVVDFDNGMRGLLELCMFADGSYHQEHLTAIGDQAKIEALVPGPSRFWPGATEREAEVIVSPRISKAPEQRPIPVDETILSAGDHHGSTYYQHVNFNKIVREGGAPDITLADGAIAVEMGAAAEQSVRTGEPVKF